jgi:hypothetical protein
LLLRQGGFDKQTRGLIIASSGCSFKLDSVISTLKGLYTETDDVEMPKPVAAPSYHQANNVKRSRLFCDHCHKRGHMKRDCWAHLRAIGQSEKANRLEAEHKKRSCSGNASKGKTLSSEPKIANSAKETFYTSIAGVEESYFSAELPFAIVDTGAVASMIAKRVSRQNNVLAESSNWNGAPNSLHKFGVNGNPIE